MLNNCATVFVSDGGGAFAEQDTPATDWLFGAMLRSLHGVVELLPEEA